MPADLAQMAIFEDLSPDSRARLAMLSRERTFSAGSHLLRQGETNDRLYVITRGRVCVEQAEPEINAPVLLAELGPGAIVGESGLLDNEPCSTTVTALEEVQAIELKHTALALLLLQYPETTAALAALVATGGVRNVSYQVPSLSCP